MYEDADLGWKVHDIKKGCTELDYQAVQPLGQMPACGLGIPIEQFGVLDPLHLAISRETPMHPLGYTGVRRVLLREKEQEASVVKLSTDLGSLALRANFMKTLECTSERHEIARKRENTPLEWNRLGLSLDGVCQWNY
ncbi:hypothetical protein BDZ89DRAFT_1036628 [Hymenopellis radicata]|nr:hypothetical protein BDZ89DRAFT_1036628 [Hymenopellis radicata]